MPKIAGMTYIAEETFVFLLFSAMMSWVQVWVDLDMFTIQFSDKVLLDTWMLIECELNKFWEGFGWFLQMYIVALYEKTKV